jgi:hypothetical protein
VIGADDLDLHPLLGGAEILDRHPRGHHRSLAAEVGIGARHVVHHADPDDTIGVLRLRNAAGDDQRERGEAQQLFHLVLPSGFGTVLCGS